LGKCDKNPLDFGTDQTGGEVVFFLSGRQEKTGERRLTKISGRFKIMML
jgi:hypothetical protein